jgi:hypothetical protein
MISIILPNSPWAVKKFPIFRHFLKICTKIRFLCLTFLPIPALAQTLNAHLFINSSFSAILGISRTQLAQVSNDGNVHSVDDCEI